MFSFYIPPMLKNFKAKISLVKCLQKSTLLLALGVTTTALPLVPVYAEVTSADFSELVSQVTQGVARVNVTKNVSEEELAQAQTAELLKKFFGDRVNIPDSQVSPVEKAFGTAFFITQDGYMLTNNHVVEGSDSITVTLNDHRELDATLVGSDERSDVAVLKIEGSNFPALPIGDSSKLKVGEPVLAIGSPFGFDYSVSSGIVSATSRNFSRQTSVPFIQTDVAINPGNSGGPLFNQKGEVIGINSRIFSDTGSYMGLSFSIPVNEAMEIYEQIKTGGKVERAYFGAFPQDIDRNLAEAYGLDRPIGALITRVTPDSPANKAGLSSGDIILKYDDTEILNSDDLVNKLYRAKPGEKFKLLLQRDGKRLITIGKFEQVPTDVQSSVTDRFKNPQKIKLGIDLRELLPIEKREMRNEGIDGGVLIVDVNPTGRAARAGLQAGDLVTNLHQKPTTSINDFAAAVQGLPETGVITVEVIRSRIPLIIGLRID